MEQKDALDGLKHISQVQRAQFDERRKYEWKIVLTTLSFYTLTVSAKLGSSNALFESPWVKSITSAIFVLLTMITPDI